MIEIEVDIIYRSRNSYCGQIKRMGGSSCFPSYGRAVLTPLLTLTSRTLCQNLVRAEFSHFISSISFHVAPVPEKSNDLMHSVWKIERKYWQQHCFPQEAVLFCTGIVVPSPSIHLDACLTNLPRLSFLYRSTSARVLCTSFRAGQCKRSCEATWCYINCWSFGKLTGQENLEP